MTLIYRKATPADIGVLTAMRLDVTRVVWDLAADIDLSHFEQETRQYYQKNLESGDHAAYMVYDGDLLVGTGGICFYRLMPTGDNFTGRKAYLMNMYTRPEYRRRGIAGQTLDLLVNEAKSRQVAFISLETSDAGRELYLRHGFVPARDEMLLDIRGGL